MVAIFSCGRPATVADVTSSPKPAAPSPSRPGRLRWWVEDGNGRVVVAQWPNPALLVWMATVVLGWTGVLGSDHAATVAAAGRGALVVWALDEVVRGASPFRRLLGGVVLVVQLARLFA
jgi:hypothetical protein